MSAALASAAIGDANRVRRPLARDVLKLVGELFRARPGVFIFLIVFTLIANSRGGFYLLAMGGLADALIAGDTDRLYFWLAVYVVAMIVEEAYWGVRIYLVAILADHGTFRIQRRVLAMSARAPLVAFEEGPFFARLQRATDDLGEKLRGILNVLIDVLQVTTMFVSIAVALWLVAPAFLPILVLGAIPSIWLEVRTATLVQQVRLKYALTDRLLQRLSDILKDRAAAAELRLFGNGDDLVGRWRTARRTRGDDILAAERTSTRAGTWGQLSRGLAYGVVIAGAVWLLLGRRESLGSWIIIVDAVGMSTFFLGLIVTVFRSSREEAAYLSDLFAFEEYAESLIARGKRERAEPTGAPISANGRRGMAIAARDLRFAYPGHDAPVVQDVSLDIAPGETVAIVGENGAGKSTLVRLLTGLYLPDTGEVHLDGVSTRSDGYAAQEPRIAAVFQDYVAYQLTARENIGFGEVERITADAALAGAAERAGIAPLLAELPDGVETWLGRQFGERDLSGGQWQRVALARAFFRDADLLVLDEPTAALDPRAEQALFERFAHLVEDKTALMISHRLGPARFADRIVVMEQGRIVEQGAHDELMQRDGPYAKMFAAQADWYR